MSQVAVMGLGEASGYAIYEHHSDARAWSVTVGNPATAVFDYFAPCINADCRFKTNERMYIAYNRVKNTGDYSGTIYIKFQELDSAGNPLSGGVSCSGSISLSPSECAALEYNEGTGECVVGIVPDCIEGGDVTLNPRPAGTYYFGIKTWAEGETEPSYPSPTAALAGAEVLPAAGEEGTGLAIPVTVVSGLALVGLGILQARSRRF